jgi:hypothetical protein
MPTKKVTVPPEVFQLKVTLLGTMPPIWRQLLVPANMTLAQLHNVLQDAMGWQDCHMHEFCAGRRRIGQPDPEDRFMGVPSVENERAVHLSDVLSRVRAKITYTYDFGDSWEHGIVLEKRLPADPGSTYPVCIGGERACPPEDCGGIPGCWMLLQILRMKGMRNCWTGLKTIMIRTLSPSMMSIGCLRPCVDAGGIPHAVRRQPGKQIPILLSFWW